jgi:hypothetical protein
VETFYLDYLYDCHLANQRLTDEDWDYYGFQVHHVETPERDGGLLTPLNSQKLTTYQHWVAGVLQSEVLGKCCFAMVPCGILPDSLDRLRHKWHSHHARETCPNHAGKVWINNGEKETFCFSEEIPEGWVRGRLPGVVEEMNRRSRIQLVGKVTGKTKWYTDGISSKRFTPGSQPTGWVEGRPEGKRGGRKKGIPNRPKVG